MTTARVWFFKHSNSILCIYQQITPVV